MPCPAIRADQDDPVALLRSHEGAVKTQVIAALRAYFELLVKVYLRAILGIFMTLTLLEFMLLCLYLLLILALYGPRSFLGTLYFSLSLKLAYRPQD
jgi:hypothetical protein